MESDEALLTSYRLRTIRTAVWASVFVLAALVAYAFLLGHPSIELIPFLTVLAIAAVGVGIIAVLPWPTLFARGWGLRAMYAWSVADIVLIAALMPFRHGTGGEIFFLYTFTTVFFSVSYPRRAQAGLLAFTFASYIGALAYLGWPVKPAELILRLALLGILAHVARVLSQQVQEEMSARATTEAESECRAELRLAELDRMTSDFISTASHELRTPLTVIRGMGLTLARQWDDIDEEMRRELLERMNASAERLHDLVGSLLDFSNIQSGVELRRESVPIAEVARSVADRMAPLLASHPLGFEGNLRATVHGDRRLLDRVLENLLANAATHTAAGTSVRVSVRDHGTEVEVEVEDAGGGIPPSELSHLGSRFFRGGDPNTRPLSGTGLGLAFVQEILRLHGSGLDIWSEVGRGSRFSFRLPRGPRDAPEAPVRAPQGLEAGDVIRVPFEGDPRYQPSEADRSYHPKTGASG